MRQPTNNTQSTISKCGKTALRLLTITSLILPLAGCFDQPNEPAEYMVFGDNSKSILYKAGFTAEDIHQYILGELDLENEDAVTYSGITVHLSWFGHTSRPPIQSISLEAGGNWFLENELKRTRKVSLFKNQLRSAIDSWMVQEANHEKTYIHNALANSLPLISKGEESMKKVLLLTDGWEDTESCIFENYKNNPDTFVASYEGISNELNATHPLPDISGIHFTLVHPRNKKYDRFCEATDNYWKYQIEKLGGTLSIHSNLMLPNNIPVSEINIQQPIQNLAR